MPPGPPGPPGPPPPPYPMPPAPTGPPGPPGPPPPSGPGGGGGHGSGHGSTAVVPGKGFKAKLDASAYKEYTNTATFVTWKQAWIVTARAQGLGDLFDPTIILAMLGLQETDTYQRMSAWMYGVMWYKVKTINGQMIVKSHIMDFDIHNDS